MLPTNIATTAIIGGSSSNSNNGSSRSHCSNSTNNWKVQSVRLNPRMMEVCHFPCSSLQSSDVDFVLCET